MNKGEFVTAMSAHGALTKKDAEHFLTCGRHDGVCGHAPR
jgi:hypothetical protein